MRTSKLAATLGILAVVCSCAAQHTFARPDSSNSVQRVNLPAESATDVPTAMAGTWHCRENTILLELSTQGHSKWWDLKEQSGRPSEPPIFEGSWFVRKGLLFLLNEKTNEPPESIGPGRAFAFHVKSVTPDAMLLHQSGQNDDLRFRRIPEPAGAPDTGQLARKAEPKPTAPQVATPQTEAASLVGIWATAISDQPQQTAWVELGADEHWSAWPSGRPDPKKPTQAGTWFMRKGQVFLLVEQTESDKIIAGMAFALDIKSVSSDRAVVLWQGREMRFRRVR